MLHERTICDIIQQVKESKVVFMLDVTDKKESSEELEGFPLFGINLTTEAMKEVLKEKSWNKQYIYNYRFLPYACNNKRCITFEVCSNELKEKDSGYLLEDNCTKQESVNSLISNEAKWLSFDESLGLMAMISQSLYIKNNKMMQQQFEFRIIEWLKEKNISFAPRLNDKLLSLSKFLVKNKLIKVLVKIKENESNWQNFCLGIMTLPSNEQNEEIIDAFYKLLKKDNNFEENFCDCVNHVLNNPIFHTEECLQSIEKLINKTCFELPYYKEFSKKQLQEIQQRQQLVLALSKKSNKNKCHEVSTEPKVSNSKNTFLGHEGMEGFPGIYIGSGDIECPANFRFFRFKNLQNKANKNRSEIQVDTIYSNNKKNQNIPWSGSIEFNTNSEVDNFLKSKKECWLSFSEICDLITKIRPEKVLKAKFLDEFQCYITDWLQEKKINFVPTLNKSLQALSAFLLKNKFTVVLKKIETNYTHWQNFCLGVISLPNNEETIKTLNYHLNIISGLFTKTFLSCIEGLLRNELFQTNSCLKTIEAWAEENALDFVNYLAKLQNNETNLGSFIKLAIQHKCYKLLKTIRETIKDKAWFKILSNQDTKEMPKELFLDKDALHKAIKNTDDSLWKSDIKLPDYLLSPDEKDQTLLHYAVKNKNWKAVCFLLDNDIDRKLKDNNNKTASDYFLEQINFEKLVVSDENINTIKTYVPILKKLMPLDELRVFFCNMLATSLKAKTKPLEVYLFLLDQYHADSNRYHLNNYSETLMPFLEDVHLKIYDSGSIDFKAMMERFICSPRSFLVSIVEEYFLNAFNGNKILWYELPKNINQIFNYNKSEKTWKKKATKLSLAEYFNLISTIWNQYHELEKQQKEASELDKNSTEKWNKIAAASYEGLPGFPLFYIGREEVRNKSNFFKNKTLASNTTAAFYFYCSVEEPSYLKKFSLFYDMCTVPSEEYIKKDKKWETGEQIYLEFKKNEKKEGGIYINFGEERLLPFKNVYELFIHLKESRYSPLRLNFSFENAIINWMSKERMENFFKFEHENQRKLCELLLTEQFERVLEHIINSGYWEIFFKGLFSKKIDNNSFNPFYYYSEKFKQVEVIFDTCIKIINTDTGQSVKDLYFWLSQKEVAACFKNMKNEELSKVIQWAIKLTNSTDTGNLGYEFLLLIKVTIGEKKWFEILALENYTLLRQAYENPTEMPADLFLYKDGLSPIHKAAENPNDPFWKLETLPEALLNLVDSKKKKFFSQESECRTPLQYAAIKNNKHALDYLLKHSNIKIDSRDNYGKNAADYFLERCSFAEKVADDENINEIKSFFDCLQKLKGNEFKKYLENLLEHAATTPAIKVFKFLAEKYEGLVDIDLLTKSKEYIRSLIDEHLLLHYTLVSNHELGPEKVSFIDWLAKYDINFYKRWREGNKLFFHSTPLCLAIKTGNPIIFNKVLDLTKNDLNINTGKQENKESTSDSTLYCALKNEITKDSEKILISLLENGANVVGVPVSDKSLLGLKTLKDITESIFKIINHASLLSEFVDFSKKLQIPEKNSNMTFLDEYKNSAFSFRDLIGWNNDTMGEMSDVSVDLLFKHEKYNSLFRCANKLEKYFIGAERNFTSFNKEAALFLQSLQTALLQQGKDFFPQGKPLDKNNNFIRQIFNKFNTLFTYNKGQWQPKPLPGKDLKFSDLFERLKQIEACQQAHKILSESQKEDEIKKEAIIGLIDIVNTQLNPAIVEINKFTKFDQQEIKTIKEQLAELIKPTQLTGKKGELLDLINLDQKFMLQLNSKEKLEKKKEGLQNIAEQLNSMVEIDKVLREAFELLKELPEKLQQQDTSYKTGDAYKNFHTLYSVPAKRKGKAIEEIKEAVQAAKQEMLEAVKTVIDKKEQCFEYNERTKEDLERYKIIKNTDFVSLKEGEFQFILDCFKNTIRIIALEENLKSILITDNKNHCLAYFGKYYKQYYDFLADKNNESGTEKKRTGYAKWKLNQFKEIYNSCHSTAINLCQKHKLNEFFKVNETELCKNIENLKKNFGLHFENNSTEKYLTIKNSFSWNSKANLLQFSETTEQELYSFMTNNFVEKNESAEYKIASEFQKQLFNDFKAAIVYFEQAEKFYSESVSKIKNKQQEILKQHQKKQKILPEEMQKNNELLQLFEEIKLDSVEISVDQLHSNQIALDKLGEKLKSLTQISEEQKRQLDEAWKDIEVQKHTLEQLYELWSNLKQKDINFDNYNVFMQDFQAPTKCTKDDFDVSFNKAQEELLRAIKTEYEARKDIVKIITDTYHCGGNFEKNQKDKVIKILDDSYIAFLNNPEVEKHQKNLQIAFETFDKVKTVYQTLHEGVSNLIDNNLDLAAFFEIENKEIIENLNALKQFFPLFYNDLDNSDEECLCFIKNFIEDFIWNEEKRRLEFTPTGERKQFSDKFSNFTEILNFAVMQFNFEKFENAFNNLDDFKDFYEETFNEICKTQKHALQRHEKAFEQLPETMQGTEGLKLLFQKSYIESKITVASLNSNQLALNEIEKTLSKLTEEALKNENEKKQQLAELKKNIEKQIELIKTNEKLFKEQIEQINKSEVGSVTAWNDWQNERNDKWKQLKSTSESTLENAKHDNQILEELKKFLDLKIESTQKINENVKKLKDYKEKIETKIACLNNNEQKDYNEKLQNLFNPTEDLEIVNFKEKLNLAKELLNDLTNKISTEEAKANKTKIEKEVNKNLTEAIKIFFNDSEQVLLQEVKLLNENFEAEIKTEQAIKVLKNVKDNWELKEDLLVLKPTVVILGINVEDKINLFSEQLKQLNLELNQLQIKCDNAKQEKLSENQKNDFNSLKELNPIDLSENEFFADIKTGYTELNNALDTGLKDWDNSIATLIENKKCLENIQILSNNINDILSKKQEEKLNTVKELCVTFSAIDQNIKKAQEFIKVNSKIKISETVTKKISVLREKLNLSDSNLAFGFTEKKLAEYLLAALKTNSDAVLVLQLTVENEVQRMQKIQDLSEDLKVTKNNISSLILKLPEKKKEEFKKKTDDVFESFENATEFTIEDLQKIDNDMQEIYTEIKKFINAKKALDSAVDNANLFINKIRNFGETAVLANFGSDSLEEYGKAVGKFSTLVSDLEQLETLDAIKQRTIDINTVFTDVKSLFQQKQDEKEKIKLQYNTFAQQWKQFVSVSKNDYFLKSVFLENTWNDTVNLAKTMRESYNASNQDFSKLNQEKFNNAYNAVSNKFNEFQKIYKSLTQFTDVLIKLKPLFVQATVGSDGVEKFNQTEKTVLDILNQTELKEEDFEKMRQQVSELNKFFEMRKQQKIEFAERFKNFTLEKSTLVSVFIENLNNSYLVNSLFVKEAWNKGIQVLSGQLVENVKTLKLDFSDQNQQNFNKVYNETYGKFSQFQKDYNALIEPTKTLMELKPLFVLTKVGSDGIKKFNHAEKAVQDILNHPELKKEDFEKIQLQVSELNEFFELREKGKLEIKEKIKSLTEFGVDKIASVASNIKNVYADFSKENQDKIFSNFEWASNLKSDMEKRIEANLDAIKIIDKNALLDRNVSMRVGERNQTINIKDYFELAEEKIIFKTGCQSTDMAMAKNAIQIAMADLHRHKLIEAEINADLDVINIGNKKDLLKLEVNVGAEKIKIADYFDVQENGNQQRIVFKSSENQKFTDMRLKTIIYEVADLYKKQQDEKIANASLSVFQRIKNWFNRNKTNDAGLNKAANPINQSLQIEPNKPAKQDDNEFSYEPNPLKDSRQRNSNIAEKKPMTAKEFNARMGAVGRPKQKSKGNNKPTKSPVIDVTETPKPEPNNNLNVTNPYLFMNTKKKPLEEFNAFKELIGEINKVLGEKRKTRYEELLNQGVGKLLQEISKILNPSSNKIYSDQALELITIGKNFTPNASNMKSASALANKIKEQVCSSVKKPEELKLLIKNINNCLDSVFKAKEDVKKDPLFASTQEDLQILHKTIFGVDSDGSIQEIKVTDNRLSKLSTTDLDFAISLANQIKEKLLNLDSDMKETVNNSYKI